MDINYKLIGLKIKECRKNHKLTQEKLAELIDISPQHVSHIESANTKLSLSCFVNICNALSVTPNELLAYSIKTTDVSFVNNEVLKVFEDVTQGELMVMLKSATAIKEAMRDNPNKRY
ncbi:MAG: helix-turn-helix transcriptional regulator [Eubacteriales bacterium]